MSNFRDKIKIGQYIYQRRGRWYQVCQKTAESVYISISNEVYPCLEKARKRVFELNGWKYEAQP